MIDALYLAGKDPIAAQKLWREVLNPAIVENWLLIPCMPYLAENGFEGNYPWIQRLGMRFGLVPKQQP